MVKPIMKDIFFLGQKSEEATRADLQVGKDLADTPYEAEEGCLSLVGVSWIIWRELLFEPAGQ